MSNFRPRVYVAGRYSSETPEGRLANTRRAIEVGIHLWHKGYAPFIPHLIHYADQVANEIGLPLIYPDWIAWDDCFQETCHLFFYDSESPGADREYRNAQVMGQPIFRYLVDVPLATDFLRQFQQYETERVGEVYTGSFFHQKVMIQRLPHGEGIDLPEYKTEGAAAMDLCAASPEGEEMALYPGEMAMVPTGFAIAIPEGLAGLVLPRSGLATKHRVSLANAPGLVDSDFRGEILLSLTNSGDSVFNFKRGDRLAQLLLIDVTRAVWTVTNSLPISERGSGGFGSTGLH
jgi:dUTP pyrophosphatase